MKCLPKHLYFSSILVYFNILVNQKMIKYLTAVLHCLFIQIRFSDYRKKAPDGHLVKPVHLWLFITNSCQWDERLTLIGHQVFHTSFWATPGCAGFTGSKWSVGGCIIAQKNTSQCFIGQCILHLSCLQTYSFSLGWFVDLSKQGNLVTDRQAKSGEWTWLTSET